jgi:hypothetical protein
MSRTGRRISLHQTMALWSVPQGQASEARDLNFARTGARTEMEEGTLAVVSVRWEGTVSSREAPEMETKDVEWRTPPGEVLEVLAQKAWTAE